MKLAKNKPNDLGVHKSSPSLFTGIVGLTLLIVVTVIIVFNIIIYAVVVPKNTDRMNLSERIISKSEANISAFNGLESLSVNGNGLYWKSRLFFGETNEEFKNYGNVFLANVDGYNIAMRDRIASFKQQCAVFLSTLEDRKKVLEEKLANEEFENEEEFEKKLVKELENDKVLKATYAKLSEFYNGISEVYAQQNNYYENVDSCFKDLKDLPNGFKTYYLETLSFLVEYKMLLVGYIQTNNISIPLDESSDELGKIVDGITSRTEYDNFKIGLSDVKKVIDKLDKNGNLTKLIEEIKNFDVVTAIPDVELSLRLLPSIAALPKLGSLIKDNNFDSMKEFLDGGYIINATEFEKNFTDIYEKLKEFFDEYVDIDIMSERLNEYAELIPTIGFIVESAREFAFNGNTVMSYKNIVDWLSIFTWICDIIMAATVLGYTIYLIVIIIAERKS